MVPSDFCSPITNCQNAAMAWPSISSAGLPNFLAAQFAANFAGITYLLDFIPPTPEKVAGLSIPSISLFLDAFMGPIELPAAYPSVSLSPLTIPGVGSAPYDRPMDAELKLMAIGIVLPFELIKTMITGLLSLQVNIPTPAGVEAIFTGLAGSLGLSGNAIGTFGGCLGTGIADMFSSLIPH